MNDVLLQRLLWYLSGSTDVKFLHPEDNLYKDKLVTDRTVDRVMDFMKANNKPLLEQFRPSLVNKVNSMFNHVGVTTGSIWRTSPSHKVNSLFDEIIPNTIGPDIKEKMITFFKKEKIRVDDFREKYQKLAEEAIQKGGNLSMPDPELHRYVDTFPDNSEEFVNDRSKYIVDQLYDALLYARNNKKGVVTGYLPEFKMVEAISPDLNVFFNRKPVREDIISFDIVKEEDTLLLNAVLYSKEDRELEEYLGLVLGWGLNCTYVKYLNLDSTEKKIDDHISSGLEKNIDNIFKLSLKDFNHG